MEQMLRDLEQRINARMDGLYYDQRKGGLVISVCLGVPVTVLCVLAAHSWKSVRYIEQHSSAG